MNGTAPRFRSAPARFQRALVPPGGLFVSCTDATQTLCAYRENASARRVHVLRGGNRTAEGSLLFLAKSSKELALVMDIW